MEKSLALSLEFYLTLTSYQRSSGRRGMEDREKRDDRGDLSRWGTSDLENLTLDLKAEWGKVRGRR